MVRFGVLWAAVLVLAPSLVVAWEYSRSPGLQDLDSLVQPLYMAVCSSSSSDDRYEREAVSYFALEGTDAYKGRYSVNEYDHFYNSFNATNTYDLKSKDETSMLQLGILKEQEKAYLVYGNGIGIGVRDLDPGYTDGTENNASEKYNESAWAGKGSGVSNGFDFFLTDIENKNIFVSKGKDYYVGSAADSRSQAPAPNRVTNNGEDIVAAAISGQYYVVGTKDIIYVGTINSSMGDLKEISRNGDEKDYSLAINEKMIFITYLSEKTQLEPAYLVTEYWDILKVMQEHAGNPTPFVKTNLEDLFEDGNGDSDEILKCHYEYQSSPESGTTELVVRAVQTSFADEYFLIVSLPLCDYSTYEMEQSVGTYMSVKSLKNIYYVIKNKAIDDTKYVSGLEDINAFMYSVSYTRNTGTTQPPETPYEINMRVIGMISGEVLVLNGMWWNKSIDTSGMSDVQLEVTNESSRGAVSFRACSRRTKGYPTCNERSFVQYFSEQDKDLPGCPIQFDGYYCDYCSPRYKKTSGKEGDNPACDSCSGYYYGPRCSANIIGTILLAIVYLILIIGSTIGYLVNRKK